MSATQKSVNCILSKQAMIALYYNIKTYYTNSNSYSNHSPTTVKCLNKLKFIGQESTYRRQKAILLKIPDFKKFLHASVLKCSQGGHHML